MTSSEHTELAWIAVLDQGDCWHRLAQEPVSRIAFVTDGHPQVLPINHAVDGQSIVFRTSSLFDWVTVDVPVAVEADHYDGVSNTGWSVVVHGRLVPVHDRDEIGACERLGLAAWAPGDRNAWFRVVPSRISGRLIGRRRRNSDGSFLPYMPPG